MNYITSVSLFSNHIIIKSLFFSVSVSSLRSWGVGLGGSVALEVVPSPPYRSDMWLSRPQSAALLGHAHLPWGRLSPILSELLDEGRQIQFACCCRGQQRLDLFVHVDVPGGFLSVFQLVWCHSWKFLSSFIIKFNADNGDEKLGTGWTWLCEGCRLKLLHMTEEQSNKLHWSEDSK